MFLLTSGPPTLKQTLKPLGAASTGSLMLIWSNKEWYRISIRRPYTPRNEHCHSSLHLQRRQKKQRHARPWASQHSTKGFWKGKIAAYMKTSTHPPSESCIRARGPHHTQRYCYLQTYNKPKDLKTHFHGCFLPTLSAPYKHEPKSLKKKWHPPLTTTPRSPYWEDHDPTLPQYWSEHLRDKEAFGANCNAFSSKFTGFSICNHGPI
jgi:hypothetical protein